MTIPGYYVCGMILIALMGFGVAHIMDWWKR
jgi:hypothetical protein